jgi:hypothetical protein
VLTGAQLPKITIPPNGRGSVAGKRKMAPTKWEQSRGQGASRHCCSEPARERGGVRRDQRDTTYLVRNCATKNRRQSQGRVADDCCRCGVDHNLFQNIHRHSPITTLKTRSRHWSQATSDKRVTHVGLANFCWLISLPMPRIDATPHRIMIAHEVDAIAAITRAHIDVLGM